MFGIQYFIVLFNFLYEGCCYKFRCLTASNIMIPAATETFSEPMVQANGIWIRSSQSFRYSGEMPSSSDPMINAIGPVRSVVL